MGHRHGFQRVELTEHHGTPDNVNPSPLILAAAMASRSSHIRLQPSAIILPLHDPIRIAEDCIMVDIVSNGRLDVVLGPGYMPDEFEMFGASLKDRGRLMTASSTFSAAPSGARHSNMKVARSGSRPRPYRKAVQSSSSAEASGHRAPRGAVRRRLLSHDVSR
ncbi:LLM class flavin-dependent oxidoreductase [Sphingobium sp. AN558]|uniref:LLM class flavin-dependent oxidoreductase n=1 Tax=Sphingobium sp. AN558 TaxID=3133442 RepID=UPI0030C42201